MGLFGIFKDKEHVAPSNNDRIIGQIRGFVAGRGLAVNVQKVDVERTKAYTCITVHADIPYNLVGPKGIHSKALSAFLSREFNERIKLNVVEV
jgi:ribosomal protein S3